MPKKHVVKQGEDLATIGRLYGYPDWRVIYEDSANSELRQRRPDPHVLLPGDEVVLPERPEHPAQFEFQTGQAQSFELDRPETVLRLKLFDRVQGEAVKARYRLELDGLQEPLTGSLDADGLLERPIPDQARRGRLVLETDPGGELLDVLELRLGELDPPSAPSGALQRLRRLGYAVEPDGDALGAMGEAAVREFQREEGLQESGELDEATQRTLLTRAGA